MEIEEFKERLINACKEVRSAESRLTEIDAQFGDADHGFTMTKVVNTIEQTINGTYDSIKEMLSCISEAVMKINGGSAVPLWSVWLEGLSEGIDDSKDLTVENIKTMFSSALDELMDISGAGVGDKTMMDAVIPATEAIKNSSQDIAKLFNDAAQAAIQGAEATRQFKSKFGRAKAYGDKTIGTPDAGAVSFSCFFKGLAEYKDGK